MAIMSESQFNRLVDLIVKLVLEQIRQHVSSPRLH